MGVNLLDVADEAGLVETVAGAAERMPAGSWIVGGQWGAYEAWAMGSSGQEAAGNSGPAFDPHRGMIDPVTPDHPTLLSRWDRSSYLANALALEAAPSGVTVNAVCPGYTDTDIVKDAVRNIVKKTGRSEEEARAELTRDNPQGRLIRPSEVADAVVSCADRNRRP